MAGFGANYIQFAPFKGAEPAAALPQYDEKVNFGRLVKAELTVTMASGKIYGDDVLDESIDEFVSGSLAVETTDLTLEHEAVIFGSTMSSTSNKTLTDSTADTVPYGGIAYIKALIRKGKKVYRGVYLPKVKATFGTDSANTKTDSITMSSTPLTFTVFEAATGEWREREEFDTLAAAKTWCDSKLAKAAG